MKQSIIDSTIISNQARNSPISKARHAHELGMTVKEYNDRIIYLKMAGESTDAVIQQNYVAVLEDRIIEQQINVEEGTGKIVGICSTEPMSGEEVTIRLKIDTTKWRLSAYWNKEQADRTFRVSGNITQKKDIDPDVVQEDMKAAIQAVFKELPITPFTFVQGPSNNKTLMVYTADKHVAAHVPASALYVNNYSKADFATRMDLLLKEIFYLETLYGKFEHIYILDLGDALDGWKGQTTRGGHQLPQNMGNREAFEAYLCVHKHFFDTLVTSNLSNNYHFKAVSIDNHASTFAYITNRALEEYLLVKYPQVTTQIFEKFIEHFQMDKHTFVICHGKDDIDMKHGFPLHLNDKTINMINHYLDQHKISNENNTVHFIKGDLHQDCLQSSSRFRYRNTSSLFGSSKWAMHNFIPQAPGVSFDVVENHTNRVFPYQLTYNSTVTG